MKLGEKAYMDGDNLIIEQKHDVSGMLRDAEYARHVSPHKFGNDNIHLGNIEMKVIEIWLKEAGVSWSDGEAVNDVIKKNYFLVNMTSLEAIGEAHGRTR